MYMYKAEKNKDPRSFSPWLKWFHSITSLEIMFFKTLIVLQSVFIWTLSKSMRHYDMYLYSKYSIISELFFFHDSFYFQGIQFREMIPGTHDMFVTQDIRLALILTMTLSVCYCFCFIENTTFSILFLTKALIFDFIKIWCVIV